jgi:uncharacterized membrane protein YgaE (UPF0421/DUF939 family)
MTSRPETTTHRTRRFAGGPRRLLGRWSGLVAGRPRRLLGRWSGLVAGGPRRLRDRMLPILQTATAAVAAWYIAAALLPDPRPVFASIAAVISVGATYGQRGERAVQLVLGVVLGITMADLIIQVIGTGAPQLGLMVLLAMSVAVFLGAGEIVVVEAAVSAILLVALDPAAGDGFSPNRILEAAIGGGITLAMSFVLFPPDPALGVGRAGQALLAELGTGLERIAAALARRDADGARVALLEARAMDDVVAAVHESLATNREIARFALPRRGARVQVSRYERSLGQLDYAVRDTRVLARHAVRLVRSGDVPDELPEVVGDLAQAVWELGAAYDEPERADAVRRLAMRAADRTVELTEHGPRPGLSELAAQVRSTAVDLVRAAELIEDVATPAHERPTEELLAVA